MTIDELIALLAQHRHNLGVCTCGYGESKRWGIDVVLHRAHVAEVVMPAIREALAQEIEDMPVVVLDSDLDIWHTAMKVKTDAARIVRGGTP